MTLIITNAFEWVMLTLRCEVHTEYCQKRCQVICFNAVYSSLNANFILRILLDSIIERAERKISVFVN